jgi:hypothetical protein
MDPVEAAREIEEWRRKFRGQSVPPALEEELDAAASELAVVQAQLRDHVEISGARVRRHLMRLRALWAYVSSYGDESRTTPA